MKTLSALLLHLILFTCANGKETVYEGSTPAHIDVRKFLGISLTDSIDFIKWKLVIETGRYELNCKYGLAKGGTDGFSNEKKVQSSGNLVKQGNHYSLHVGSKILWLLEINPNLLHLLDRNKSMLVGNGGYSYTLNLDTPEKTDSFNLSLKQIPFKFSVAFEGRTPCQELAAMMGLNKSPACNKMKWYIIFYVDSVTGKPSYYLKGGMAYKKETMARGRWEILRGKDGREIYKLDPEKQNFAVYLLKADENILLFTDSQGNLLVGNKDFSYTLNRTHER